MTLADHRRHLKFELMVRRDFTARHALPIVWAAYGLLKTDPSCVVGACGHALCTTVCEARRDLNASSMVTGYYAQVTDRARMWLKRLQKIARASDDREHLHAYTLALDGRDPDLSTVQGCTFYRHS